MKSHLINPKTPVFGNICSATVQGERPFFLTCTNCRLAPGKCTVFVGLFCFNFFKMFAENLTQGHSISDQKFCDLWEILFTLDVAGFCMKNKDTHTKRLLLKKNFLVLKDFLGGGSCLIWYRRHENRPASCWFRWKSWKYLGATRIPVKLPFGQAFLKWSSPQHSKTGYSVLFHHFTGMLNSTTYNTPNELNRSLQAPILLIFPTHSPPSPGPDKTPTYPFLVPVSRLLPV